MAFKSPGRTRLFTVWLVAIGFQSGFALVALLHPSMFGYRGKLLLFDDVRIYFDYARPSLEGRLPYRDYSVEYPVLALPFFAVPLVVGGGFEVYQFAFVFEMLAVNAVAVWLVAQMVEESEGIGKAVERLVWYSAFFAALCPMIVARFDLVPMLLAFAGARWLAKGRMMAGGLAAGLGMLVKLVPGLVIVPVLAGSGSWKPKARTLAAFSATVIIGGLGWWWLGGEQVVRSFRYHGERGLELGSLYASGYLVAHHLAGVQVFSHFDHGSMNLSGPGSHDAAMLAPIVQGAMLALVAGRSSEAGSGQAIRLATASILAFILPGKVLSPQYLIWLIPFVCVLGGASGRASRWVFLASCVLTTAVYPFFFHALSYFEPGPVALLTARNFGLAWLFAMTLGPRSVTPTRSSPAACS